jgi:hypothetical protein
VWPIEGGAEEPVDNRGDVICESTLPNVSVPLHVLFPPAQPELNDEEREAKERVRQRLRELLETPASGEPQ